MSRIVEPIFQHRQKGLQPMDEEFKVVINDPITAKEAVAITGVSDSRIQQLCREYKETKGEGGLKSKKFGHIWQIERESAEEYERTNRGPKPND